MITEDYCSFELSKLLKEKGFDGPCFSYYKNDKSVHWIEYRMRNSQTLEKYTMRPYYGLAMKWLREKGIFVEITAISLEIITFEFEIKVIDKEHGFAFYPESGCNEKPTYVEAVEAAIKYSLEKLI